MKNKAAKIAPQPLLTKFTNKKIILSNIQLVISFSV